MTTYPHQKKEGLKEPSNFLNTDFDPIFSVLGSEKEKTSPPPMFLLYSHTTTIFTILLYTDVGSFNHTKQFVTPTRYLTIELNSDTIYLRIVSDPTGEGLSLN